MFSSYIHRAIRMWVNQWWTISSAARWTRSIQWRRACPSRRQWCNRVDHQPPGKLFGVEWWLWPWLTNPVFVHLCLSGEKKGRERGLCVCHSVGWMTSPLGTAASSSSSPAPPPFLNPHRDLSVSRGGNSVRDTILIVTIRNTRRLRENLNGVKQNLTSMKHLFTW